MTIDVERRLDSTCYIIKVLLAATCFAVHLGVMLKKNPNKQTSRYTHTQTKQKQTLSFYVIII